MVRVSTVYGRGTVSGERRLQRSASWNPQDYAQQSSLYNKSQPYPYELDSKYSNIQVIHQGRDYVIIKAFNDNLEKYECLKVWYTGAQEPIDQAAMKNQIDILQRLSSVQGIAKVSQQPCKKYQHYEIVAFDYYQNGTLMELICHQGGRVTEFLLVTKILFPLLKSLTCMHTLDIVHRNIQPENIIFDDQWHCYVIGFRSSQDIKKNYPNCNRQSMEDQHPLLQYQPPELLNPSTNPFACDNFQSILNNGLDDLDLRNLDQMIDIWCLGCMVFECLTGHQPFEGYRAMELFKSQTDIVQQLNEDRIPSQWQKYEISEEAINFLKSIFKLFPGERPKAMLLKDHKLITQYVKELTQQGNMDGGGRQATVTKSDVGLFTDSKDCAGDNDGGIGMSKKPVVEAVGLKFVPMATQSDTGVTYDNNVTQKLSNNLKGSRKGFPMNLWRNLRRLAPGYQFVANQGEKQNGITS